MCEFVNFTHSKIWRCQKKVVPLQAKLERDMEEKYVTLEEMYDILMRDEYKEFREENDVKIVTLEDGTRRLSRIINGYIADHLPLLYRHIEAEEILIRDFDDEAWNEVNYRSYGYYKLYELWKRPLVWVDPLEEGDSVIDGRIAREGDYRRFFEWELGYIIDYLRDKGLTVFADNPPIYTAYKRESLDFGGIHSWSTITRDYSAIDKKIDNGGCFSLKDYKLVKEYDAKCLRENLVIISRLKEAKRSAELLRMLQAEWPTLKRWNIDMSDMSKEEIEEFEEQLFHGFDDLLEEWEEDKEEEVVQKGKRFSLLTDQCVAEGKEAKVISELRAACKGTAPALWKVIRTNEALGYLGTRDLEASVIYRAFTDYFGKLPYTERNFRDARGKV